MRGGKGTPPRHDGTKAETDEINYLGQIFTGAVFHQFAVLRSVGRSKRNFRFLPPMTVHRVVVVVIIIRGMRFGWVCLFGCDAHEYLFSLLFVLLPVQRRTEPKFLAAVNGGGGGNTAIFE